MTTRLILVKHALPEIDRSAPASSWALSDQGRADSTKLASLLSEYRPGLVVTSREPKTVTTASVLADELELPAPEVVQGLHEHERETVGWLGDEAFDSAARALFANQEDLVWGEETARAALTRFSAAIDSLLTRPHETIVVVTHGTVISLFAQDRCGTDGFEMWKRLTVPSFVVIDAATFAIQKVVDRI
jgi:broad specificity phosphatase PhoE